MPVLGGVGDRSGKQGSFLRPRRDLGKRRSPDREIDRPVGDLSNRRTFAPSGGRRLTVPVGHALCDERRQVGDVGGDPPRLIAFLFAIREAAHVDRVAGQQFVLQS